MSEKQFTALLTTIILTVHGVATVTENEIFIAAKTAQKIEEHVSTMLDIQYLG